MGAGTQKQGVSLMAAARGGKEKTEEEAAVAPTSNEA